MCEESMATNLALDDSLLDEALKIGNLKTKKDTVTTALKEFIARRRQLKIKDLAGTIDYDDHYDYKKMRNK
jgi:Arc/MetJ family transcription regulator